MSLKDRTQPPHRETPTNPFRQIPSKKRSAICGKRIEEVMNRRERMAPGSCPSAKRSRRSPWSSVVTGEEVETPQGRFFFSRSRLEGSDFHGHSRVCDLACLSMEAAAFLAGTDALKGLSLEDGLFLDTETTGLAGGTGTFPFLIGLGWFEKGGFVTCQLFARDFSEETCHACILMRAGIARGDSW